ncbi:MAG: hypothetical protein N4A53_06120 [Pelagimonas sp.]|jgi:hypothetical protein|nr:hypothetical protein [Pelagimonas sp.]
MRAVLFVFLLVNFGLALGWFLLALLSQTQGLQLIALGHLSLAALYFFPVLAYRPMAPYDPLNLVALFVVIGCTAPSYFITFDQTRRIQILMGDLSQADFIPITLLYAVTMLLVGFGYAACKTRLPVERILPREDRLSARGFQFAIIVGLVLGLGALALFVERTGGLASSIADISRKRAVQIVSNGEVTYASAGYLRMIGSLSVPLMLIVLSYYLGRFKVLPRWIRWQIWLLCAISFALPFIASARSSVVFTILGLMIVLSVHNRLSRSTLIATSLAVLVIFGTMSALRSAAQRGDAESFANPFLALAESGNGLSLFGTAHIVTHVPDRMKYQLGSTYLTWITAPIPRSVWPGKPDVSLGKRIKGEVMQARVIRTGRPPSIINEGWINFGLPGMLLAALAFGYVLRLVPNSLNPVLKTSAFAAPLYFTFALDLANLSNAAFSQGVVRILTNLVLIWLCYLLIQHSFARKRQRGSGYAPLPAPSGHAPK